MAAISKSELEKLEAEYGLEPDGLTYQHRCSRITAYMKGEGENWRPPEKKQKQVPSKDHKVNTTRITKTHPLYGRKLLITPMMTPDAKRNLAYDEVLGPEMIVKDYNAGEAIYGEAEDIDRMVGDYIIERIDNTKSVVAKTTFPKIGTEIAYTVGKDLVPVVTGNDHKQGYIWSLPTQIKWYLIDDELYKIQIYGLKTFIRQLYPMLEPHFSGKPMMDYIDGVTLAASIPQTHALLAKHIREEAMAAKAGLPTAFHV